MQDDMQYGQDIITLVDEDGNEHVFEVVGDLDEEDNSYVALIPVYDDAEEFLESESELIVLKVSVEEDDEFLEHIDDEEEYERVSAIFMDRLKDEFDFIEEE